MALCIIYHHWAVVVTENGGRENDVVNLMSSLVGRKTGNKYLNK